MPTLYALVSFLFCVNANFWPLLAIAVNSWMFAPLTAFAFATDLKKAAVSRSPRSGSPTEIQSAFAQAASSVRAVSKTAASDSVQAPVSSLTATRQL